VFTFNGAPDTVLIIMPLNAGVEPVTVGVVKLLGSSSVNASVAALRAHLTRTTKLLESATNEKEIEAAESKRDSLNARIVHLLALATDGPKQLTNQSAP